MVPLFKSMVRPIIEYANSVWAPYLKQDIQAIENIQKNFTKRIYGMNKMSYHERLEHLKLPSLEYRRLRGDMRSSRLFMTFMILKLLTNC